MKSEVYFGFLSRRLREFEAAQWALWSISASNLAVITGLFLHLIKSADSSPRFIAKHVHESLSTLHAAQMSKRFGMFFLNDLDIHSIPSALVGIQQEDDEDVFASFHRAVTKRIFNPLTLGLSGPPEPQQDEEDDHDYPIGPCPIWTDIVVTICSSPWKIMIPWVYLPELDSDRGASHLFVQFTKQMFLFLRPRWTRKPLQAVVTLEDAMKVWTPEVIFELLTEKTFTASNAGLKGSIAGARSRTFGERMLLYFPEKKDRVQGSWRYFLHPGGYLSQYYNTVLLYERTPQKREELDGALVAIFAQMHCQPNSSSFLPWLLNAHPNGGLDIICNPATYRIVEIGKKRRGGIPISQRRIVGLPPSEFAKLIMPDDMAAFEEEKRLKLTKKRGTKRKLIQSKNRRMPPVRKATTPSRDDLSMPDDHDRNEDGDASNVGELLKQPRAPILQHTGVERLEHIRRPEAPMVVHTAPRTQMEVTEKDRRRPQSPSKVLPFTVQKRMGPELGKQGNLPRSPSKLLHSTAQKQRSPVRRPVPNPSTHIPVPRVRFDDYVHVISEGTEGEALDTGGEDVWEDIDTDKSDEDVQAIVDVLTGGHEGEVEEEDEDDEMSSEGEDEGVSQQWIDLDPSDEDEAAEGH